MPRPDRGDAPLRPRQAHHPDLHRGADGGGPLLPLRDPLRPGRPRLPPPRGGGAPRRHGLPDRGPGGAGGGGPGRWLRPGPDAGVRGGGRRSLRQGGLSGLPGAEPPGAVQRQPGTAGGRTVGASAGDAAGGQGARLPAARGAPHGVRADGRGTRGALDRQWRVPLSLRAYLGPGATQAELYQAAAARGRHARGLGGGCDEL
mmetsp:Transcript_19408/g.44213  ORF Transcript_19408/g.44213 Transcript_19408/m.44213 type:complete len:202 (+) Transcript_19408:358-963(+)